MTDKEPDKQGKGFHRRLPDEDPSEQPQLENKKSVETKKLSYALWIAALLAIIGLVVGLTVGLVDREDDEQLPEPTLPPQHLVWSQLGEDIDGEAARDFSGTSVSMSANGTILAIGALLNEGLYDEPGDDNGEGHVRVFQWTNSSDWLQLGPDIDGEAAGDAFGYATSLSSDGKILAVGAYSSESGYKYSATGHVRTFEWNGNNWQSFGFNMTGEEWGDWFGASISLSSDGMRLAVGAPQTNRAAPGYVRIFERIGDSWDRLGQDIYGELDFDDCGYSVTLTANGSRVAIGSDDHGDNFEGHVRVFDWTGNMWSKVGQDLEGDTTLDGFGSSVAFSENGTILAIGAPDWLEGYVRVFEWGGTKWERRGEEIRGESDFGQSVALSMDGSILAIGAADHFMYSSGSGSVRVFEWESGNWTQIGQEIKDEAQDDTSGWAIALSADGSVLAVGAPWNDGNGDGSGSVRVFQLSQQPAAN